MTICAIRALSCLLVATLAAAIESQQPFALTESIPMSNERLRVPGNNDAIFGPIPPAHQIFDIHFLDIAPAPIPLDRFFFMLMRGEIVPSRARKPGVLIDDAALGNATMTCIQEVTYANGEVGPDTTISIPLRTSHSAGFHLSFRDWARGGAHDQLVVASRQDIVADMIMFGETLRSGTYTWKVQASLPDGDCLFAVELSQWLTGQGDKPEPVKVKDG